MQVLNLLGGLALATSIAAQTSTGQACPSNEVSIFESCSCPYGTNFQLYNTYAVLGVSAADFNRYTSSFTDIRWLGITNLTSNGPDGTIGATRAFSGPTSVGTLTFTEKLDSFQSRPDGSYITRISQFDTPIRYPTGNGSFSGYWITLEADYAAQYETVVKWSIYTCFTGNPIPYGAIHINALTGLLATMEQAGLVKGNSIGPWSALNP